MVEKGKKFNCNQTQSENFPLETDSGVRIFSIYRLRVARKKGDEKTESSYIFIFLLCFSLNLWLAKFLV